MPALEHMTDAERCADDFKVLGMSDASRQQAGDQAVLLSQVLAHPVNIGYETVRNILLEKFNGEKVTSLAHLKALLEAAEASAGGGGLLVGATGTAPASASAPAPATGVPPPPPSLPPLVFEFATGQVVVLDSGRASAVRGELCRDHGMSCPWSPDLE